MLRGKLGLYLDLIRWNRPAGWLLLLWPSLSALWVAADGFPGVHLLLVFVLGMFIDFFEIAFIVVPLLAPVAEKLDINLIWFGIILVKLNGIATLSPPVGLVVFVVNGVRPDPSFANVIEVVSDASMHTIDVVPDRGTPTTNTGRSCDAPRTNARATRAGHAGQIARSPRQCLACQPGESHGLDEIGVSGVRIVEITVARQVRQGPVTEIPEHLEADEPDPEESAIKASDRPVAAKAACTWLPASHTSQPRDDRVRGTHDGTLQRIGSARRSSITATRTRASPWARSPAPNPRRPVRCSSCPAAARRR